MRSPTKIKNERIIKLWSNKPRITLAKAIIKCLGITLALLLSFSTVSSGQVLISLIFGDKLNSGPIEFGLEGGLNFPSIQNVAEAKRQSQFNLGFFFYIRMSDHSYITTGVLVKETQGASNLDIYSLNNPELDTLFAEGFISREIGYFQVPIGYHYRFGNGLFAELALQPALRNKAYDYFTETIVEDDDVVHKVDISDQISRLDIGLVGGLGYKLRSKKEGIPGMSLGAKYYYGLVDVNTGNLGELKNDGIHAYIRIPIGAGKANKSADAIED